MSAQDVVWRLGIVFGALGLIGAGTPPAADGFGSLQVAMSVASAAQQNLPAFAGAHSYRVVIAETGRAPVVAIVDDDTSALKMTSPEPGSPTTYFVGGTMYSRSADGAWTKLDARSLPKRAAATPAPARDRPDDRIHALPDRIVHGVRIGSFTMNKPARWVDKRLRADKTITVTCSYEKANGRLRSCSVPQRFTMTWDRYDDPSNRFTLPSAALHAPDAFR